MHIADVFSIVEIKETRTVGDSTVTEIRAACRRLRPNREGKYESDFRTLSVWGKGGDVLRKNTVPGDQIFIDGEEQDDQWEKEGVKHSMPKIRVNNFKFCGAKRAAVAPQEEIPEEEY